MSPIWHRCTMFFFLAPFHSAKLKGKREKSVFSSYHLYVLCPAWHAACFFCESLRCRQITASPSSLRVRTFVTECRPLSLCNAFTQGHKRRRSARHALNAGVTKAGQPRANRIPLLYPCYTFTPLCVCLLQDDYIVRSFFHCIGYYPTSVCRVFSFVNCPAWHAGCSFSVLVCSVLPQYVLLKNASFGYLCTCQKSSNLAA